MCTAFSFSFHFSYCANFLTKNTVIKIMSQTSHFPIMRPTRFKSSSLLKLVGEIICLIFVAFVLFPNRITDVYESFIASVLGYLLTNGETSPFYQTLLESGLGSDFSPNTGYVLKVSSCFCIQCYHTFPFSFFLRCQFEKYLNHHLQHIML